MIAQLKITATSLEY